MIAHTFSELVGVFRIPYAPILDKYWFSNQGDISNMVLPAMVRSEIYSQCCRVQVAKGINPRNWEFTKLLEVANMADMTYEQRIPVSSHQINPSSPAKCTSRARYPVGSLGCFAKAGGASNECLGPGWARGVGTLFRHVCDLYLSVYICASVNVHLNVCVYVIIYNIYIYIQYILCPSICMGVCV